MARKSNETMLVKLTSSRAGNRLDAKGRATGVFAQSVGDIIEMEANEAQRHIDAGLAVLAPAPAAK